MVPQSQYGGHRGGPRQQAGIRPQHYQQGNRGQARPMTAQIAGGQPVMRQQQIPQGKPIQQGQPNYYPVPQGRQGMLQQGVNTSVPQEELGSKLSSLGPQVVKISHSNASAVYLFRSRSKSLVSNSIRVSVSFVRANRSARSLE